MKRKPALLAFLQRAQRYIRNHAPDMRDACYTVHPLDGPPGAPRVAVTAEQCSVEQCPYHVTPPEVAAGQCPIRNCPLRCSIRLLYDANGHVVQATTSHLHWPGRPRRIARKGASDGYREYVDE